MTVLRNVFSAFVTAFSLLLLFALLNPAYAADSSSVQPAAVISQPQVTVTVTHYRYDATSPYTPQCPSNGSLIESKFFPWTGDDTNPSGTGAIFFKCAETYWPANAYYQSLLSNAWVSCNSNTYAHPTTGESCSIQATKPMLLRVLVPIPPTATVTAKPAASNNAGFELIPFQATIRVSAFTGVGNASQYLNKTSTSPGYFGLTILYGGPTSTPPIATPYNINYNFNIQIDGTGSNGLAKQYDCFGCQGNAAHYLIDWTTIPVTYEMLGQTCIVTYTGLWTDQTGYYYTPSHPGTNSFTVSCSP